MARVDRGGVVTIPKKGGYSGGRPASEMGPPAKLRKRVADPRDDLRDLVHDTTDESSVTIHRLPDAADESSA
jgi:hypothetical protein